MTARLTAARARELFSYDPTTGALTWRVTNSNRAIAGRCAGSLNRNGYMTVFADGFRYTHHRVIWLITTGEWPTGDIDHRNGKPADNRLENLRDVSRAINQQNRRTAQENSSLGLLGVRTRGKRFTAQLTVDGRAVHIGTFDTPEEAEVAHVDTKRRLHPGCTL